MDPFVPSLVLFFVLSFILVNGGGLPAILFGFAVVAGLSLLVHHFSLCNRGVLPLSCRRTHALLAAICGIICSSLLCWKIYYAFSKPVAAACFFLVICLDLSVVVVYSLSLYSQTDQELTVSTTVHVV